MVMKKISNERMYHIQPQSIHSFSKSTLKSFQMNFQCDLSQCILRALTLGNQDWQCTPMYWKS